jgi:ABC-2 type transport system ATP-binding protein
VDEPTAGLNLTERNRFLYFLSEIAKNVAVILSTHILEDVTELCSNMTIIAGGEVVATGQPTDVTGELRGKVFRTKTEKAALAQLKAEHEVISSKLVGGAAGGARAQRDAHQPRFRARRSHAGRRVFPPPGTARGEK